MNTTNELLRRAQEFLKSSHVGHDLIWPRADLYQEIETYLATADDADAPVAWMHPSGGVIQKAETWLEEDTYTIPLYLHPPKPAEPEAIITKLEAENFALASGQCTEGGPWGDEGGTPYCKYAARQPITDEAVEEELKLHKYQDMPEYVSGFLSGISFAEHFHGIGGGE